MGTNHPATSQLTLNLEMGLAQRHRSLRDCVAAGVYARGLKRVAGDVDESPSKLSEKLAGGNGGRERDVGLDLFERYIDKTGDTSPVLYLVAKYLRDPTAARTDALARLEALSRELPALLQAAKAA